MRRNVTDKFKEKNICEAVLEGVNHRILNWSGGVENVFDVGYSTASFSDTCRAFPTREQLHPPHNRFHERVWAEQIDATRLFIKKRLRNPIEGVEKM